MPKVIVKFIDGSSYKEKFENDKLARQYSMSARLYGVNTIKKGWFKRSETFYPVTSILSITINN